MNLELQFLILIAQLIHDMTLVPYFPMGMYSTDKNSKHFYEKKNFLTLIKKCEPYRNIIIIMSYFMPVKKIRSYENLFFSIH